MKDNNIGFIGLGNVGSKLAKSILLGGYNLFIYDIKKNMGSRLLKKGAIWSKDIQSICKNCSVIITCLPSPKAISKVIEDTKDGLVNFVHNKHLWIEMSTTDENEMRRLSKIIELKGAQVLECPVTGGVHRSETGNISVLVAGKRKAFNRSFPILSELGYKILYCGKIGNASTLKIVTNFLASTYFIL